ncbi:unnamed protein product [Peronospora farinosa]|uniref:Uncharacterized protein n=1 Tax=Peronospora farinosa TaxID=134698 RepID=A0AAV0TPT8_9STRA|nr:unnamed protein product [Peronospora farinosa]CAI5725498.1 unnamed protein product [Peronospora farinosa]
MGKRKSPKKTSSLGGAEATKVTSDDEKKSVMRIARLFMTMQKKGVVWNRREREGIKLIEGFQSALLALRDAQTVAPIAADREKEKVEAVVQDKVVSNVVHDPWLTEDLYQEIQKLSSGFEELLEEMCTLQVQAREIVLGRKDDVDQQVEATQLRPVDYLQMMSQELATFEAEYQHIEALLRLISFETSTDELRTLLISWSTSPFLHPDQTRHFLQRHLLSNQLHT